MLVVGGGICGLSTAYYCALLGNSVTVVEREIIAANHTASSVNSGLIETEGSSTMEPPEGVEEDILDCLTRRSLEFYAALEQKGHHLNDQPGSYGGYQAIRIDLDRGVLFGGSDPRKDGAAIGY